jgi:hypothetical protein
MMREMVRDVKKKKENICFRRKKIIAKFGLKRD